MQKFGYSWQSQIKSRRNSPDLCPCCDINRAVNTDFNDILTLVPSLATIYDFEENTAIDISSKGVSSTETAAFSYKACGHKWSSPICQRVHKNKDGTYRLVGCPVCANKKYRKVTYAEQYPELDLLFNKELNNRTLSSVKAKDSGTIRYWWTCASCHNVFQSRLRSMITAIKTKSKGCPYCSRTVLLPGQSFGDLHPDLLEEYAPENSCDPFVVFPNNSTNVLWVCRNDPNHT